MKQLIYYSLFFILIINLTQCSKDENFIISNFYSYSTTSTVLHDTNIVSIGDTIWIKSVVKDSILDSMAGEIVYFTEAELDLTITIRSWSTDNQSNQSGNYNLIYNTTVTNVTQLSEATMSALSYDYIEDEYIYEVGVVFTKKGIYSIDTDYLYYKLDTETEAKYYGGGSAIITNADDSSINYGSLDAPFENRNNNFNLYEALSANERLKFEEIESINSSKYYFINVVD